MVQQIAPFIFGFILEDRVDEILRRTLKPFARAALLPFRKPLAPIILKGLAGAARDICFQRMKGEKQEAVTKKPGFGCRK
jgi:hypothetical protein